MPKSAKRVRLEGWHPVTGLMLWRHHGDRALQVGLTRNDDGKWVVLALEVPGPGSMQDVLDSHAHKLIGVFEFAMAIRRAEAYAKSWRPSASSCPCDDIAPGTRRAKPKADRRDHNIAR